MKITQATTGSSRHYEHCCDCGSIQKKFDPIQHKQHCAQIAKEQKWAKCTICKAVKETTCQRCGGEKRESATNEFLDHDWEDCFKYERTLLTDSRKRHDKLAEDLLTFGHHINNCAGFCYCGWTVAHLHAQREQLDRAREVE